MTPSGSSARCWVSPHLALVVAQLVFKNFFRRSVDRASCGRNLLQDRCAVGLSRKGAFQSHGLTFDASGAGVNRPFSPKSSADHVERWGCAHPWTASTTPIKTKFQ